jgi:hypothetical protein
MAAPIKLMRTTLPAGGTGGLGNATSFQGNPISPATPVEGDSYAWSAVANSYVLNSTGTPSGTLVCPLLPLFSNLTSGSYAGVTAWLYIPAWTVQAQGSMMTVTLALNAISGHVDVGQAVVRRQNPVAGTNYTQANLYLDSTPITWGGSATPVFNGLGLFQSDPISVPVDTNHDLWILIYFASTTTGAAWATYPPQTNFLAGYDVSGNVCGNTTPASLTPQRYLIAIQSVRIA